jgi:hypothetical protein
MSKLALDMEQLKNYLDDMLILTNNFDKSFHIYTGTSDHQLGAVIMQDKMPLAFYSRKLNAAQKRNTTTESELLSNIETCKKYKNIIIQGYPIPSIV